MKTIYLQAIFTIFAFVLFIPACTLNDPVHQQVLSDQQVKSAEDLRIYEYEGRNKEPEAIMTEPIESKPENENSNSADNQTSADNTPCDISKSFTLITHVNEVKKEYFFETFGQEYISTDPVMANAVRIAEVEINEKLFSSDQFSSIAFIHLELFDGTHKQVQVETHLPGAAGFSLQGRLEESPLSVFFLSVTEQQALATLRLPDINTVYTIKYLHPAGRHYLFQGLITEVEHYECEVKTPPVTDSIN